MKYFKSFITGICSGLFIGFGCILYNLAQLAPIHTNWTVLLGSLLFSIGMILVCFLGTDLFTGKIGFVFEGNVKENFIKLPIMLIGNIIGIGSLGIFMYYICSNFAPHLFEAILNTATSKYIVDFIDSGTLLFDAICCGIMVYLAVFSYKYLQDGLGILGIILFISIFVYCGFQHSIANCFYYFFMNNWNGSAWAMTYQQILGSFGIILGGNMIGALLTYMVTYKTKLIKE